ncbi:hypothetical protein [Exiguobacterium undae]|uniref:hypothetical protein n=1 Tax=Exiguobacterium undae TaxID=169177 RepID=UPI00047DD84F|nr:hypothetical protein [Exiguobacterium undae]
MKKALVVLLSGIFLVLTGCSQADTESTGSYAMMVVVNNKEYNGTEDTLDTSKQLGKEISRVIKKTKVHERPQENNQSNYFHVGSRIYSVKGTEKYIIVKDKENKKWVLKN